MNAGTSGLVCLSSTVRKASYPLARGGSAADAYFLRIHRHVNALLWFLAILLDSHLRHGAAFVFPCLQSQWRFLCCGNEANAEQR